MKTKLLKKLRKDIVLLYYPRTNDLPEKWVISIPAGRYDYDNIKEALCRYHRLLRDRFKCWKHEVSTAKQKRLVKIILP